MKTRIDGLSSIGGALCLLEHMGYAFGSNTSKHVTDGPLVELWSNGKQVIQVTYHGRVTVLEAMRGEL